MYPRTEKDEVQTPDIRRGWAHTRFQTLRKIFNNLLSLKSKKENKSHFVIDVEMKPQNFLIYASI